MTKKEMAYEIISNTNFAGMNEKKVNAKINRTSKERVEQVYKVYKQNPTTKHAEFCWCVM